VEATPLSQASLYELVRVGPDGLLGEVIRLDRGTATVQVFENTSGLALGDPVLASGAPLEAELGPGLLGLVMDGTGRPLPALARSEGAFIRSGTLAPSLDRAVRWRFEPRRGAGDRIEGGDVLGIVNERGLEHRILVPPGHAGILKALSGGDYTVDQAVGELEDGRPLFLMQRWPVRLPRPAAEWLPADRPFLTGQRVFDFLFPVAEGGSVAVPGGFGTGKTVIEQSLARYAEADVVVYVGCGERGNEMAEVLEEFPRLDDSRTGRSLMDRTVLVVNTSNMPVAAREASIYLGLTIAEYWRDQGYRVALMADSLSRWAEALREIGSLLREMPGEEGFPTALGNRLGKLFERAGRVRARGSPERTGAVTVVAALSPPGGDFSEPVTQAALRVVAGLWALDARLAHQRQFPAVDWETSYSLQADGVGPWFAERAGADWPTLRRATFELLQRDRELREVAGLVGPDALEDRDRLTIEAARLVRDVLIGQSAYDPADASSPVVRTGGLARLIHHFHSRGLEALAGGRGLGNIDVPRVRRALETVRTAAEGEVEGAMERSLREVGKAAGGEARR
jgi:V/A-type H+-transporting ATPase subunit A